MREAAKSCTHKDGATRECRSNIKSNMFFFDRKMGPFPKQVLILTSFWFWEGLLRARFVRNHFMETSTYNPKYVAPIFVYTILPAMCLINYQARSIRYILH